MNLLYQQGKTLSVNPTTQVGQLRCLLACLVVFSFLSDTQTSTLKKPEEIRKVGFFLLKCPKKLKTNIHAKL
jgi:hypothetical protein